MLIYTISHQERYSRTELLLRTFFGWFYIMIPHYFLLFFLGIASLFTTIIAFFAVLFTGRYPRSLFDFIVAVYRWMARVEARIMHLADGYPAFGLDAKDAHVQLVIPYPERLSRGLLLLRLFFGWLYFLIPHGFVLIFRGIASMVLTFLAWFAVLFTGKYPPGWHAFNMGTLRWNMRVNIYSAFLSDTYPPFSGKPDATFKS